MSRILRGLVAAGLATIPALASPPPAAPDSILGQRYPLEAGVTFHAALLHWLDSLAGLTGPGRTAGKTIEGHRAEFVARFGAPSPLDVERLRQFAGLRSGFAAAEGPESRDSLTVAFFDTATLEEALERSERLVGPDGARALADALAQFTARYRSIWDDGRIPRRFVASAEDDARTRRALARFLARVARFFGVEAKAAPQPRLVLAPVPRGCGTHAQAIGRHLLLEIREDESLLDQVPPIVHENAHFLFHRLPAERRAALEARAERLGPGGVEAWRLLLEALPTAIAQGVAGERFLRERWSIDGSWYHRTDVDAYAKALLPLVDRALTDGQPLDEAFLDRALALRPR